ncbi:MAG: Hint domain-containing protein [Pseudomonadota bacterium]
MPETFNVVFLGNLADMDPSEGDTTAENATGLVGLTFGSEGDALVNDFVSFSPGSVSYTGGTATAYDQDATTHETFRIDGGSDQSFDSTAAFNATITYIDGSTASLPVVIFQDTLGNTYWAPQFSANANQALMEAAPIRSLTLDSLINDTYSGMTGSRETWSFVVCFVAGSRIATPFGPVRVECLTCGSPVCTLDHGVQTIRWVGQTRTRVSEKTAPIRFRAGSLGEGQPKRDLMVSPQHRMLVRSKVAQRVTGAPEVLVAAKKLLALPGVEQMMDMDHVDYVHILLERHALLFAEGALSESLLPGPFAMDALGDRAAAELRAAVPELVNKPTTPVRAIPPPQLQRRIAERLAKNKKPACDNFSPPAVAFSQALP